MSRERAAEAQDLTVPSPPVLAAEVCAPGCAAAMSPWPTWVGRSCAGGEGNVRGGGDRSFLTSPRGTAAARRRHELKHPSLGIKDR